MVKRLFAIIAVILFVMTVNPCFGKDKCTKPTEFMPSLCPIKFPRIKTIRIEENGARSPKSNDTILDCSVFKFTEKKVRRYISLAMTTSEQEAMEVLDWSPCYASGTLTFVNGKTANWYINQGKGGMIYGWEDINKDSISLYCPKCKFKPFTDESE